MSIASEIQRISSAKADLKSAINAKGGGLTTELIGEYAAAVTALPGADLSGVTAEASDVTSGKSFVTSGGVLTSGTLAVVTPPSPTVSLDSATGVVSAAYTPLAGRVTDTAAKSATLQLQTVGASSYTPGSAAIVISGGQYLTGDQTIAGDANLVAANIASGVSIFGVTGTHSGGGSASIAAAKVLEYHEERAALTAVSTVTVSGLSTYDPGWGEEVDISYLNGTYNVTSETQYQADAGKRVYKHASANYYLLHIYSEDMGEHYWCLTSSATLSDPYSAILAHSGETFPSGSNYWTEFTNYGSYACTTTPTTTSYPEQQFALSAADAADINPGGVWSFGSATSLSGCDFTPAEGYIHLRHGTRIITPPVAHPGPGVAPVFSLPLHLDTVSTTGHTITTTGASYEFVRHLGRECCHFLSGSFHVTVSQQSGTGARTLAVWICNLPNYDWHEMVGFADSVHWQTFDLFFRMSSQYLVPEVLSDNPFTSPDMNGTRTTWNHLVMTVGADGACALYVNGESKGTASLGRAPSFTQTDFVISGDTSNIYFSDINLYDAALTADQVAALYKQEALYMGTIVR